MVDALRSELVQLVAGDDWSLAVSGDEPLSGTNIELVGTQCLCWSNACAGGAALVSSVPDIPWSWLYVMVPTLLAAQPSTGRSSAADRDRGRT
ncbi:hypothetical protein [Streptomyces sp. 8N616]|uniref:hypothetical protein n=1 Tax=Streptomyces sp. 8N616 TaxID=3457414 RepID=UPI003FD22BE0